MLVLARAELIIFPVAGMGLCFGQLWFISPEPLGNVCSIPWIPASSQRDLINAAAVGFRQTALSGLASRCRMRPRYCWRVNLTTSTFPKSLDNHHKVWMFIWNVFKPFQPSWVCRFRLEIFDVRLVVFPAPDRARYAQVSLWGDICLLFSLLLWGYQGSPSWIWVQEET